MTRKQVGRNAGNSRRSNVSGSEVRNLGLEAGAAVAVDVADTTAVAHAHIDSVDSDESLTVTPD